MGADNDFKCYWDVLSDSIFYCGIGLAICTSLLLLRIIRMNYKLIMLEGVDWRVKIVFFHLLLWGIFHLNKLVFGALVYWNQLRDHHSESNVLQYSRYFCVLDSLATTTLQGALFIVPYIWIKSVVNLLIKREIQLLKSEGQTHSQFHSYRKSRMCLQMLKIYIFLREIILISLFLIELAISSPHSQSLTCQIINFYIMAETLVFSLTYLFGISTLCRNYNRIQINERDKKQLYQQFLLLAIICVHRTISNQIFIINDGRESCLVHREDLHLLEIIFYQIIGNFVGHYYPVILLLRFYQMDFSRRSKQSFHSLIIEDDG